MKPSAFHYVRAIDPAEVCTHLSRGDSDAKVLAGGQSLVPMMKLRLIRPAILVDINEVRCLDYLRTDGDTLSIGALQRFHALEASPDFARYCPLGRSAMPCIGHEATRTRGTLCGSLAHADPAAEMPVIARCLDAELVAAGPNGTRTIAAADFFVSFFTTALEPDELLIEARLPCWRSGTGWAFYELSKRHAKFVLVAATLQRAVHGGVTGARIALGAVGETPVRAAVAETALEGQPASAETFRGIAELAVADIDPPSDVHGSGPFRRKVARVLVERALQTAWERTAEPQRAEQGR